MLVSYLPEGVRMDLLDGAKQCYKRAKELQKQIDNLPSLARKEFFRLKQMIEEYEKDLNEPWLPGSRNFKGEEKKAAKTWLDKLHYQMANLRRKHGI